MDFLLLLEGSASAGLRKLGWGDARGTQEQVGISLEGPALLPLRLPFQHPRWRSPLGAGLQADMRSAEPQGQAWEGDEPRAGGSVPGTRCSPGPLLPDPLGPALAVRVETRWSDLCWGLSRSPPPPPLTPAQVLAVLRAISLCSRLSPRPLQGTCSERTDARVPQLHLLLSSYEGVLFCSTVLSRGAVDTSGLATLSCGRLCCVLSHIQQQHPDLYLPDVSSIAPT